MHRIFISVPKSPQKWCRSMSVASLRKRTSAYAKHALTSTNDPMWIAIPRLRTGTPDNRTRMALAKCNISDDDFLKWKPVLFSPSLRDSVDMLGGLTPSWVLLALAFHRVRTPSDAQDDLLRLALDNAPTLDARYKPAFLVLTTHSLAHFGIIVPMRQLVDSFLHTTQNSPFHFNTFLQALSHFAGSQETANLALAILEAMTSRQIPLWLPTYRSLLKDRFVTLQLTKYLHARMIHEGVVPSAEHLEAYLKIFARYGAIHEAGEYLKSIQEYCIQHSLTPPYGPIAEDASHPQTEGVAHSANTHYLKSMHADRASAFHYLHYLLQLDNQKRQNIALPKPSHSIHCSLTPRPFLKTNKQSVDIYDWTTTLVSVASDLRISTSTFIRLFENARTRTKAFRPTIATYTVLLRGLLWRKAYNEALEVWDQLIDSGQALDRKALTVGIQVLTRAGHPQKAFYLLDSFVNERPTNAKGAGTRPHFAESQSAPSHPTRSSPTSTQVPHFMAHRINIIVVNEFLVSLLRIRRPDIVFMIWDNLELLYGVLPNNVTLNILLKSALLAVKMDRESVRGVISHLTLKTPFRTGQPSPLEFEDSYSKRERVARGIMEALEDPEPPSVVGIWRGRTAAEVAREIFRGMIFGNWPQTQHIQAPVTAVRPPGKEGTPIAPIMEVAKSLVVGLSHKAAPALVNIGGADQTSTLDSQSQKILGPGAIPTVHPSQLTFLAYIKLLGLSSFSYTHEIPLVLAWMRHLSVRPSRFLLSISLVFWAEVSLRGPIFEEWAEKGGYSKYGRLERWIREWAKEEGWENMDPREADMSKALFVVARMRDRNFGTKHR
ncbi:hypothetical protein V8B97DRAFT_1984433 [Scleroderma yunnanense]